MPSQNRNVWVHPLHSRGGFKSILIDVDGKTAEALRDDEVEALLAENGFEERCPSTVALPLDLAKYRVVLVRSASAVDIYLIGS
jgi:hypothetical protein